jgi:CMP-N-acetylneuraminic acid synthetase
MHKLKNIKLFIPIKQKSQRFPNKNFKIYRNKKLYQYVIEKYKKFDGSICVDTDSKEIIEYCKYKKIDFIKRKPDLVGHDISVVDLIKNYIIEKNITGYLCQVHVTNPLLEYETIKNAYCFLKKYDCVVGANYIYNRFWIKNEFNYKPINHNPKKLIQTQDLKPLIVENSCFYILDSDFLLSNNTRIGNNPFFYEVKYPENIDIDTEEDWKLLLNVKNK